MAIARVMTLGLTGTTVSTAASMASEPLYRLSAMTETSPTSAGVSTIVPKPLKIASPPASTAPMDWLSG